jgi:DNA (cytosine-5)-methyltransferase 1
MPHPSNCPQILDLFCGCGGLSLGAEQAGFRSALSIDQDVHLTSSFAHNFPLSNLKIADIGCESARAIKRAIGSKVDGVIGGPPCQGFSSIGRQDEDDPRRGLLLDFFRIVREVSPKFFLVENVQGLAYERNRKVLDDGLQLLPKRYRVIGPMLLNSASFGAATSRPRIFVFGYDTNEMRIFDPSMFEGGKSPATVKDAIADLGKLKPRGLDSRGFDLWSSEKDNGRSNYAQRLRGKTKLVTGHRKTPHKKEIVERFATVPQGGKDEIGKHVRLSWTGQCPTIRAGTGSDRGSYQAVRPLHPTKDRVITVREAARLQGFPDRFLFHPTTWHSFRMIGNSVSPIIAHGILSVIYDGLKA